MAPWDRAFQNTDAIKHVARAPPFPGAFQKSILGKLSCSICISFYILLGGSGPLDNAINLKMLHFGANPINIG